MYAFSKNSFGNENIKRKFKIFYLFQNKNNRKYRKSSSNKGVV